MCGFQLKPITLPLKVINSEMLFTTSMHKGFLFIKYILAK